MGGCFGVPSFQSSPTNHKPPMETLQTLTELGAIAFLTLTAFLLWE